MTRATSIASTLFVVAAAGAAGCASNAAPGGAGATTATIGAVSSAGIVGAIPRRTDSSLSRWIDSAVAATIAARRIPGASVAVLRRDTLVHVAGYGVANLETTASVTPATIFQIASLTKPFTAAAVLLLVEEGKLKLDDLASRYVSQLPSTYASITIRQLLTHTSGIAPDMRRANVDEMELPEFWRRLSERPSSFAPGANIQYANTGYTILSFVVERASGRNFGDFLRVRIFAPLGMTSSAYRAPKSKGGRHATGYEMVDGRNVEMPHVFSGWGNSGIETTVDDLARFAAAIERRRLLSHVSWELTFTPGTQADGTPAGFDFGGARAHYGLGWFLTTYRGRTLQTHGGAIAGFSSILNRFPDEGYTIIVLSNSKQGGDRLGQADAIARAIAAVTGVAP